MLRTPEVLEKFLSMGTAIVAATPDAPTAFIKSEMARLTKVVRMAEIKGDCFWSSMDVDLDQSLDETSSFPWCALVKLSSLR